MSEQSLPNFVTDRLKQISATRQIPLDTLLTEYDQVYKLHAKEAELTDEEKHRYAVMILWKDYVARPPAEYKNIIVAGIGGDRLTSTKKLQGEAMVLVPNPKSVKKYTLRRLVLQESIIAARAQLLQFAGYKTKLGEFSQGGDLVADDRADFSSPINTGLTFEKLMEIIGATRVPKLIDAAKFPSKIGSTGYVDATDWKIIRGVVDSSYVGDRKNKKTKFGVYNIIDTSLGQGDPELTEDGRIIRPSFTAWAAPELVKYANNSLLDLAGPISLDDQKKPSMNAYAVKLITGSKIGEDE